MKAKWILAVLLILAATDLFALHGKVKSLPIVLKPVVYTVLERFWVYLAMKGAMEIAEEMAEPLANYEVGIKFVAGSVSETFTWPDGEYPTRDIDRERTYDYNPVTKVVRWFFKTTWTTIMRDGTTYVTVSYSTEPPLVNDFNNKDVHYNRIALSGTHSASYSHDGFETVTAYCLRKGNKAWGLPVMAIMIGWEWTPLWRNDTLFHNPIRPYEDQHYLFLGPTSSGAAMAIYKPRWVQNTEFYSQGVATLYFHP